MAFGFVSEYEEKLSPCKKCGGRPHFEEVEDGFGMNRMENFRITCPCGSGIETEIERHRHGDGFQHYERARAAIKHLAEAWEGRQKESNVKA